LARPGTSAILVGHPTGIAGDGVDVARSTGTTPFEKLLTT